VMCHQAALQPAAHRPARGSQPSAAPNPRELLISAASLIPVLTGEPCDCGDSGLRVPDDKGR
jgi:hypothetical protein